MTLAYWEDVVPGTVTEYGGYTVSEEEIIAFATEFDPQSFHIDRDAAKSHFYGGIIASGWHTAALLMRMMVDNRLSGMKSQGSPGVSELRWLKPVRPGDTLRVRQEILGTRPLKSRPGIGAVENEFTVLNQHDEPVLRMRSTGFFGRRPDDAATES
ncbi:MaoC family dehydratase [Oceanibacterium hippocampi]|uniref:Bifunctional protein PaaZ n=1 Tax=Oceanibacterium hippocampi TaxID=745714 RepID=A0A1Y5TVV5_9PROT|nr:MaoC family dehydratase [Oceanibacterium hippocampi]SLN74545.1 Bifunctional protein PaaZ [Oceanibacterium hippocampi]